MWGWDQTLTVNYLEYLAIRVVTSAPERLRYWVLGDVSSSCAEGLSTLLGCTHSFVYLHGKVHASLEEAESGPVITVIITRPINQTKSVRSGCWWLMEVLFTDVPLVF